ncbi:hypothetical protein HZH68_015606 [Vespula germanica]|uniref:Uncharacterized protein n=1 Tax=Vespula germanica TaxID=30212 RepID=A0A834J4G0_VESGE|nr:hypothetical protein HZH68_015606 [Vespula germanica]
MGCSNNEKQTWNKEAISEGAVNGPEYGFNGKYYVKSLVNGTIPTGLSYYQGLKPELVIKGTGWTPLGNSYVTCRSALPMKNLSLDRLRPTSSPP